MELHGGLGNQLFQIAAACSRVGLSNVRVVGAKSGMHLSVAEMAPKLYRSPSVFDRFRIGRPFAAPRGWQRVLSRALRPVRRRVAARQFVQGSALADAFEPRPDGFARFQLLSGYFQHPDWFRDGLDELIDALLRAAPPGWTCSAETTTLVLRGGDYRRLGWELEPTHYERAIELLGGPQEVRLISDDAEMMAVLEDRLGKVGVRIASAANPGSAVDDFWAIAASRRVVMSNSTFCWWATVVGDAAARREGIERSVVFPAQWIGGHGRELCMPGWVAL